MTKIDKSEEPCERGTFFEGDNFFSGDVSRIDLGVVTQKEAVTFYDDNTLVFTDEEYKGLFGGNVYEVKLDQVKRNVIKYRESPKQTEQKTKQ